MKILSRLLPAALAALLACSGNTDDLKPKTAAECGMLEKPCGYKCVSVLDPASGCGGSSCEPCTGTLAFCDPSTYACTNSGGLVCTGTQADCDGVGACENLATDLANCGACAHPCEGPFAVCVNGICDAAAIGANDQVRGVAYVPYEDAIYWLDTGTGTLGRLMRWRSLGGTNTFDTAHRDLPLAEGASGPDPRVGSPALQRIAANPLSAYPQVYLTGWRSGGNDFTIFRWDPTLATPTLVPVTGDTLGTPPTIPGLAAMGPWAAFTRADVSGAAQPVLADGTTVLTASTSSNTPLEGITAWGVTAYFGYAGTLASLDLAGNVTVVKNGLAGIPTSAVRVAVDRSGTYPEYAWASENDGSVWRWVQDGASEPVRIHDGNGTYTQMELAMDRDGVYWVDRGAGEVWEWRRDGVKFPLARSVSSNGIAVDASFVYFTDNSSGGSVKRIAK
jgi:hypothetical protein